MNDPSVNLNSGSSGYAPDSLRSETSHSSGARSSQSIIRRTKKEILRENFINEVADYIEAHNGPDSEGRAHFEAKRFNVEILESALERAYSRGLSREWKPYHFKGHFGTWKNSLYLDEVLIKRVDDLLASEKFEGCLHKLFTEVTTDSLRSPLIDTVAGKKVTVSMGQVCNLFRDSPYEMLSRYRELKGLTQYEDFRPYHMATASQGIYKDRAVGDEVLVKKVDSLLDSEQFNGDFHKLFAEVTTEDLLSPLIDSIAGKQVIVSMGQVGNLFRGSRYEMLSRYRELKGLTQYEDLKSYHMAKASKGTYEDRAIVDEVLSKKIDQLLGSERFGGDLHKLFTEVTKEDLLSPLIDSVAGKQVIVSMGQVARLFRNSPYEMVSRYRELKGLTQYEDFRPYHMAIASMGTYKDGALVDEVLSKKVDQLLVSERFDRDIHKLFTEVTTEDLLSPLIDSVAGKKVTVSMAKVGSRFRNSRYEMLSRYRVLKGLTQYEDFRPYHTATASQGTYKDKAIADEVLVKKVNQLLYSEQFHGDFHKLYTEILPEDLASPLIDNLAGKKVTVSMATVGHLFQDSLYEMLNRYCQLTKRKIPGSRACYQGSSETRKRRLEGNFNAYDKRLMRLADGNFDTRKFGFQVFQSSDKSPSRELVLEQAASYFGDHSINYLGLEDQHLESIRLFREYLNLDSSSSVVVERDERVFNAMMSLRSHFRNGEGKALKKVTILNDAMEKAIHELEGPFNLVNLDYVGHLAKSQVETAEALLNGRLADRSLLVFTHQDIPLAVERTARAGLGDNGARELPRIVSELCGDDWTQHGHFEIPYIGGVTKKDTNMVTQGFFLERKTQLNENS